MVCYAWSQLLHSGFLSHVRTAARLGRWHRLLRALHDVSWFVCSLHWLRFNATVCASLNTSNDASIMLQENRSKPINGSSVLWPISPSIMNTPVGSYDRYISFLRHWVYLSTGSTIDKKYLGANAPTHHQIKAPKEPSGERFSLPSRLGSGGASWFYSTLISYVHIIIYCFRRFTWLTEFNLWSVFPPIVVFENAQNRIVYTFS